MVMKDASPLASSSAYSKLFSSLNCTLSMILEDSNKDNNTQTKTTILSLSVSLCLSALHGPGAHGPDFEAAGKHHQVRRLEQAQGAGLECLQARVWLYVCSGVSTGSRMAICLFWSVYRLAYGYMFVLIVWRNQFLINYDILWKHKKITNSRTAWMFYFHLISEMFQLYLMTNFLLLKPHKSQSLLLC